MFKIKILLAYVFVSIATISCSQDNEFRSAYDAEIASVYGDIVIGIGKGDNEHSALKNACRNATSQVAGTIINSSIIIEADDLVEDKIIAASSAFISDLEILSSQKDLNGVYTVRIVARVLHDKIRQKVHDINSKNDINIKSLRALSENKKSAQNEIGSLLVDSIYDYMKLWNFVVKDKRIDKNSIIIELEASILEEDYTNTFQASLIKRLNAIGIKESNFKVITSNVPYIKIHDYFNKNPKYFGITILKRDDVSHPYKDYVLSHLKNEIYALRVELKSTANKVLATKDISLCEIVGSERSSWWGFKLFSDSICFYLNSVYCNNYGRYATHKRKENITFPISVYPESNIDKVAKISVELVKIKNNSSLMKWY